MKDEINVPDWVLRLLLRQLAERCAREAADDSQLYPGENFGSLARWAMLESAAGITDNEDDDLLAALLQPYVTELVRLRAPKYDRHIFADNVAAGILWAAAPTPEDAEALTPMWGWLSGRVASMVAEV